jgi:pimeloyl-ACP methyl ester carboxylesterase
MPHVQVGDLTMYYEEHGTGGGPVLVLLHGFTSTGSTAWRNQVPPFGAQYRLLVPDWRGHGRTDNPGGATAMNHRQFARDMAGFCRALKVDQAIFCGTSSGAMQLLSFGLESPGLVRALVLTACSHYYAEELRAWWRQQTPETVAGPERQLALQQLHTALGPEHWRTVVGAWIGLGDHTHTEDFPKKEELHGIQAPTLIIHGDRDRYFPVEVPVELYRLLPDAELCLLPRTGHGPAGEHPEWFNPIVLDFLTRRAA